MGSGSPTCPRAPPSCSRPSTCGLSSTSRSQSSTSRPSPISNAPSQSAASFSMTISSASGQTSTGGPSRPSRANQPDSVSVWHGTSDLTVSTVNATENIKQWTDVHGLPASPTRQEIVDGHPRRVWENAAGEEVIEDYLIEGMDHGTPIAISAGEQRHGA